MNPSLTRGIIWCKRRMMSVLFMCCILLNSIETSSQATTSTPGQDSFFGGGLNSENATTSTTTITTAEQTTTGTANDTGSETIGSINAEGMTFDGSLSAASVVDFTGEGTQVAPGDIGTSGITNEIVGAKPGTGVSPPNKRYITLEEANADNDKLYLDPALCDKCSRDITSQTYCFLPHEKDCRKYVHCSLTSNTWTAHNRKCGFGTFWSPTVNACQFPLQANCENDLCRNPNMTTYGSRNGNCRSYWQCNNGVSMDSCCDKYFSYQNGKCVPDDKCTAECPDLCQSSEIKWYGDEQNCRHYFECIDKKAVSYCCPDNYTFHEGHCEKNSTCEMECPEGSTVVQAKEATQEPQSQVQSNCDFEIIDGGKRYKRKNAPDNEIMRCASTLIFSLEVCTCDRPPAVNQEPPVRDCKYDVCIDFEHKLVTTIDTFNVRSKDGIGNFNGDSVMGVRLYSENEKYLNDIVVSFIFKSTPNAGHNTQVLVSNCRTTNEVGVSPSFAVITNRTDTDWLIFIAGDSMDNRVFIAFEYMPGEWTSVKFSFNGEKIMATTHKYNYTTKQKTERQHGFKIFEVGTLKKSIETLKVGKCLETDGFVGEMDDICLGSDMCMMDL